MARTSKCDKLSENDRLRLIGMIGEGKPWREIGAEFGIPTASIHEWAERNGYQRTPTAAKRMMVQELLARPAPRQITVKPEEAEHSEQDKTELIAETEQTERCTVSTGRPDVDAAAQEDARDMRLGLQAARLALQVSALGLQEMRKSASTDARQAKVWSECVAVNVATIRRIRGLDDTNTAPVITIERSYGKQS